VNNKKPPTHERLITYTSPIHLAMKTHHMCGLQTRSLNAANPAGIHALLLQSIEDQIEAIIKQHPSCPPPASYQVDALLLTADRLGGK